MEVSWMRKGGSEVASRVNMGDKDKTWEHCLWAAWRPGASDMEEISRREQQRVREAVTWRRVLEAVKSPLIDKLVHLGTNLGCPGLGPSNLGCSSLGPSRKAKFLKLPQQGERLRLRCEACHCSYYFCGQPGCSGRKSPPFLQSLEEEKQWREIMDTEEEEQKKRPWAVGWGKEQREECKEGNHWVQPVSQDLLSDFIDGETEAQEGSKSYPDPTASQGQSPAPSQSLAQCQLQHPICDEEGKKRIREYRHLVIKTMFRASIAPLQFPVASAFACRHISFWELRLWEAGAAISVLLCLFSTSGCRNFQPPSAAGRAWEKVDPLLLPFFLPHPVSPSIDRLQQGQ